jgi:hypothetical protein
VLSSLTDVISKSMDIIGLNHQVTYDIMVDKFDVDCRDKITKLCEDNNLIWHVIPYPYVSISKKYDDINKEYYRTEKIGARIVFEDPTQTEYVEPSIKEYELDMSDVKWKT